MSQDTVKHHPAFEFQGSKHIESLNIDVQEFEHKKTGAKHIHFASDNPENVFLVALRTVPEDSTGVAHILEHTALCGSKKYPVRDPFFMMTRRSLNTFMNAFTSSDWTAYPFASFNRKDYDNLLDVYLDAVFFSRLDPLDFAQEGHRLEFKEPDNPNSELEFKGVVFNEMKGAMSSVSSQLWHTMSKYLFPSNTYHFNSGGEPEDIPDLSYEQLMHFYKTHYHPSNASFMTCGDISAYELQEKFEKQALSHFDRLDSHISVPNEKRYHAPIRIEEAYPNSDDDLEQKAHVVLGWLLGESTDLESYLKAQLIASLLLDNSASPLLHALETSDLGLAPSPLCGLDDSQKEMSFMCGFADCKIEDADAIEAFILETLEQVAAEGLPHEDIEAALHQLELGQREVTGDSYPYGLQIILKAISAVTHRGEAASLLDLEYALEKLRAEINKPDFLKDNIQSLFLENSHRVRLSLRPDNEMAQRKVKAEEARLAAIKSQLSDEEKQAIVKLAADLKARQDQVDDESILPKVGLEDVPPEERGINGRSSSYKGQKLTQYKTGTNGLCYQQLIFDLADVDAEHLPLLSLYSSILTELGAGDKDYLRMQKWQTAVSGGISSFSSIRGNVNSADDLHGYYVYSGKALKANAGKLAELLSFIISHARFDEYARIKDLISQIRINMEQSITGNGHVLAMHTAASGISASASLTQMLSGFEAIKQIKSLDKSLSQDSELEVLGAKFSALHKLLSSTPSQVLYIGDEAIDESSEVVQHLSSFAKNDSAGDFSLDFTATRKQEAWICNSQVNFCAMAFPTVTMAHADAAPLVVLGNFLRNGYLHKAIREQGGAYGGGASQDVNSACFRFYSYRDPRIEGTLKDFKQSIAWLSNQQHASSKLEEAILGTASSLDRSESPAGQAKRCFQADLHGRTPELRKEFRERVLATTMNDLRRVAEHYLSEDRGSSAVVTNKDNETQTKDLGLESRYL
jgi:Zn-dependent M16 (insulinase) family peptidase